MYLLKERASNLDTTNDLGGSAMNANNIKTNQLNSVNQQARLLMVGNRKRQNNRQSSMLERLVEQINLK